MSDQCKCDMRTKLVGDGCRFCNPQILIGMLSDETEELEKEIDALRNQVAELQLDKERLDWLINYRFEGEAGWSRQAIDKAMTPPPPDGEE